MSDFYLFMVGSLASCCKDFGLPEIFWKDTDFDYSAIQCWDDATKHKEAALTYVIQDCIALAAIYREYASSVYDKYKMNIAKYCTKASLAINCFTLTIPRATLYKQDLGTTELIRKAYYGGRTTPQVPDYESAFYDSIIDECIQNESLTQDQFDAIHDYCAYVDVNSLYPSA